MPSSRNPSCESETTVPPLDLASRESPTKLVNCPLDDLHLPRSLSRHTPSFYLDDVDSDIDISSCSSSSDSWSFREELEAIESAFPSPPPSLPDEASIKRLVAHGMHSHYSRIVSRFNPLRHIPPNSSLRGLWCVHERLDPSWNSQSSERYRRRLSTWIPDRRRSCAIHFFFVIHLPYHTSENVTRQIR